MMTMMIARTTARLWEWRALALCWCAAAMPLRGQIPGGQDLVPLPHPDIAPPVIPPEPVSWGLAIAGIVTALVLMAVVLWLLFRRRPEAYAESVSPLKRALSELEELQQALDSLTADELAHRVSVILRKYLQARYGVPAPYRTTQELYGNSAIQAREGLRDRFGPVAEFYDRLEFAPQPATRADSMQLIEDAVRALRDEKRYTQGATPPPLPSGSPNLPFMPTKM
jgi:hypothetical protein